MIPWEPTTPYCCPLSHRALGGVHIGCFMAPAQGHPCSPGPHPTGSCTHQQDKSSRGQVCAGQELASPLYCIWTQAWLQAIQLQSKHLQEQEEAEGPTQLLARWVRRWDIVLLPPRLSREEQSQTPCSVGQQLSPNAPGTKPRAPLPWPPSTTMGAETETGRARGDIKQGRFSYTSAPKQAPSQAIQT